MASDTFWNRFARRYAASPISDPESYEYKLERTRTYFSPDATVLELGCGTGSTALLHAHFVSQILATDLSDGMLAIAREKAAQAGVENVEFERAEVCDVEPVPEGYDVVMAMSLLHLLPNRSQAIEHIHKLLKPGGYFISSTTCLMDGMRYLIPVLPLARLIGQTPYVAFFSLTNLTSNLELAGFEIIETWRPAKTKAAFIVAKKV